MTTFPNSPRLIKGAIVGFDPLNPIASVIMFQYNPNEVRRDVQGQLATDEGAGPEVTRLQGPPREKIDLTMEIDATDQLEKADPIAGSMGIYPQLSALEMLLYPKSADVILNTALLSAGTIEVIAPEAPFTLLIWGVKRVLPVRITSFTITEQEFDPNLNPLRASVPLSLNVLSYSDFAVSHPGYHLFLAHQVVKEAMASIGSAANLAAVAGGNVKLL